MKQVCWLFWLCCLSLGIHAQSMRERICLDEMLPVRHRISDVVQNISII